MHAAAVERARRWRGTWGRATPSRIAAPVPTIEKSLSMKSSSIIASTIAVVPTLRNVATSHRLASPDDHVQAPVLLRVGVRLVARVDDRALQRGLEADLLLEEVGPLAELVVDRRRRRSRSRPCRRR